MEQMANILLALIYLVLPYWFSIGLYCYTIAIKHSAPPP
jgi:hypothetical protein